MVGLPFGLWWYLEGIIRTLQVVKTKKMTAQPQSLISGMKNFGYNGPKSFLSQIFPPRTHCVSLARTTK